MTWLVGETAACAGATPTSAAAIAASAASAAAARRGRATPPRTWIGSDGSTGIVAVRMIHPLLGPQYRGRPWWWVLDANVAPHRGGRQLEQPRPGKPIQAAVAPPPGERTARS